jgi:hypothetical protein
MGDPIKVDEMGRACGMPVERKKMCTGFQLGNLEERDNLVDLDMGVEMML